MRLFFYTDCCDDFKTLERILKYTRIKELRGKLVNDFFEYCLISYIAREDEAILNTLATGGEASLDGWRITTQDYFVEQNRQKHDKKQTPTPDVHIQTASETIIIDAYDGTSEREIKSKCNHYKSWKPAAHVHVFSSGISRLEQLELAREPFQFTIDEKKVTEITIGSRTLSIDELNRQYFEHYAAFKRENSYWRNCERTRKIEKTVSRRVDKQHLE